MAFMDWIVTKLYEAAQFFNDLWYECYSAFYVPDIIGDLFFELYLIFNRLARQFSDFSDWVDDIAYKITTFFSELDLEAWFQQWETRILDSWDWVTSAWDNVTNIIEEWWLYIAPTVRGWIDSAVAGFGSLIDQVSAEVTELWETVESFIGRLPSIDEMWGWFTNWWANILTPLTSWWNEQLKQLDRLINDTIAVWFPWYENLVEIKDKLFEFFTDPLEWLLDKFTDWFLGPEV